MLHTGGDDRAAGRTTERRGRFTVSAEIAVSANDWKALPKAPSGFIETFDPCPPLPSPPTQYPDFALPWPPVWWLPAAPVPAALVPKGGDEDAASDEDELEEGGSAADPDANSHGLSRAVAAGQHSVDAATTTATGPALVSVGPAPSPAPPLTSPSSTAGAAALAPGPTAAVAAPAPSLGAAVSTAASATAAIASPVILPHSPLAGMPADTQLLHHRQFAAALGAFVSLRNNVLALGKAFGLQPGPAPPAAAAGGGGSAAGGGPSRLSDFGVAPSAEVPSGTAVPTPGAAPPPHHARPLIPPQSQQLPAPPPPDEAAGDPTPATDVPRTAASGAPFAHAPYKEAVAGAGSSGGGGGGPLATGAVVEGDHAPVLPHPTHATPAAAGAAAGGGLASGGSEAERALRAEVESLTARLRVAATEVRRLGADALEREKSITVLKQKLARATGTPVP